MNTTTMRPQDWQQIAVSDFMRGQEWLGMAGVIAMHAAFLAALVYLGFGKMPDVMTPPAVVGILVPATPPVQITPPKPIPPAPRPPEPKPVVQPKKAPPPVKAPPSERAVTAPRTEQTAPRDQVKQSPPSAAEPVQSAPAPQAQTAPAPVIPPRTDASHLNNPEPNYPPVSRRMGEEGQVLLDVHIQPDGSVDDVKLKRSSGFPRLDEAAVQAVRRWRYVPARRGNEPIAYWYVQPVKFSINN